MVPGNRTGGKLPSNRVRLGNYGTGEVIHEATFAFSESG